jgi:hypothetical protein
LWQPDGLATGLIPGHIWGMNNLLLTLASDMIFAAGIWAAHWLDMRGNAGNPDDGRRMRRLDTRTLG